MIEISTGILDMGSSTEDPSFLIYASVRKGYTAPTFLKSAEAIIHSPNSISGGETISLRDDGLCMLILTFRLSAGHSKNL